MACPWGSLTARFGQHGRVFAVHPTHWLIYAQALSDRSLEAILERHALARGNDDEFIDEFLDMAVPCQCANQILRRLRAFVHPTHRLICTQVIVYDLIDEDMNGTLAKEELVKACGEVSGGVFLR